MTTGLLKLDVSIAHAMQHVEHMRIHFPNRKSGNGVDRAAGDYIVDTMRSYGLDAELQAFETFDSDIGEASLRLDGPDGTVIDCRPCLHIEPTRDGGETAELVDVGAGAITDYEGKDVSGKFVLAEVSYAPATPEKARIAASMGAAGIILMNWGKDTGTEIPWRALKSVWGNPTPETWHDMPRIAGISISRRDGIMLRGLLKKGAVHVHASLTSRRVWRTLYQPLAWLHAPETAPERDQFVIVSGHLDSWDPGVTDNITGMAVMMEIARNLSQCRDMLRRSLVFCFWNGHEVAEAAGSTHFVDSHWERINRDAVAYINIDSVGMKGAEEFHVNASPELAGYAEALSRTVFAETLPQKIATLRRVGDQSFFGIGVPAMTGRHSYAQEVVTTENGATLGWYNHTEFDTIDVLDEAALAQDLDWCARTVFTLAATHALPYRLSARLEDMAQRFDAMIRSGEDPADLGRISTAIEQLKPAISWFDGHLEAQAAAGGSVSANRVAMRLARLLTFPTSSAIGRYGQDSYGVSTLASPVPMLADLETWRALPPDALEARLLRTRLIRRRQTVTDALVSAAEIIADFKALRTAQVAANTMKVA